MNKKLLNKYQEFLNIRKLNEISERQKRLLFLVDDILDLTTYCEEYSIEIGEIILDIMKYIFSKYDSRDSKYDYSKSQLEFNYIVYVQFIIQYLEWGISIYSAWFNSSKEIEGIKLTSENVAKLIKWLDGKDE